MSNPTDDPTEQEFDAKVWDIQFKEDASSRKLDKVSEQALNDYKAGKCKKPLPAGFSL